MKTERPSKDQLWVNVENNKIVAILGVGAAKRNPLVRYSSRTSSEDLLSYSTVKMAKFLQTFRRVKSCSNSVGQPKWYQKED